jgi:hypothetical protein
MVVRPIIPLRQLWDGFSPCGFNEGVFVFFKGYIDESYGPGQNVFAISCLLAKGKHWQEMERVWKLHLNAKNKELTKAGRPAISRYHASDCSGRRGEFDGWSLQERDAFVIGLFSIFRKVPMHTVVFNVQLNELCEVFPEWSSDRLEAAYELLTGFLMFLIGEDFEKFRQGVPVNITLFHDQTAGNGKYDPAILRSFNRQVNDPKFKYGNLFTTIAPQRWQHCIALQPADLVAFESFKEAERRLEGRKRRKSLDELIRMDTFGIHSKRFQKEALHKLRNYLEDKRSSG